MLPSANLAAYHARHPRKPRSRHHKVLKFAAIGLCRLGYPGYRVADRYRIPRATLLGWTSELGIKGKPGRPRKYRDGWRVERGESIAAVPLQPSRSCGGDRGDA